MEKIIIGVDPHKLSATIEVVDHRETGAGLGPVRHRQGRLRRDAQRVAAGRTGSGRSRAATAPAGRWRSGCWPTASTWSTCPRSSPARARMLDTGHGRKTDADDAHSVAVSAVRAKELRVLALDPELEALRMLVDRREELAKQRTQTANRLQRLLAELTPGKAKKDITALQAKAILAGGASPRPGREDPPSARRRAARRARRESRRRSRP